MNLILKQNQQDQQNRLTKQLLTSNLRESQSIFYSDVVALLISIRNNFIDFPFLVIFELLDSKSEFL